MGYSADKTAYNSGINTDISTQTTPNSIPPEVVGAGYTDLADLLEPYINSINNQALLFGPTVPSNSLGVDLDLYFRQANPIEIYRKVSGVWVLQGTLPLGFTLPEGNLTVRTSIDGFVVTATKGGWVISNTVYQKNTQTQLLVDPADLNFGRIDNIYANTSNNILYQVGVASVTPTAPILPANTILIDQVIVPASSSGNDPYLLFGGGSPSDGETNFGNSTGLITGGVLTINADPTKFNVSQGSALFVDYTTPIPPTPPSVVNFGPLTGLTVTNLGSAISSYIGIDGDQVIHQQITPFTPTQRRSIATLGILIHSNLTVINAINTQGSNILSPANQLHDFIEAVGPLNLSGNKYSNASTNLTIQKTAGSIFKFGCNSGDYTNPHQLSLSAGNPVTFRYRTRNGVETADTTNIIPGSYDNAGTITAVGANQWTNQHITVFQSGLTRIQYGQNLYGNSAEALAASLTEAFAVEANIAANGIFRCILTIRGAATNLSLTTDAIFSEVPKFGGSVGNAGSALTAANIIAALGYTPVDGPATSTDNAIARYDGTNGNVLQDSLVTILDDGNMVSGSTGGNKLPTGTTAQRPTPLLDGYFRKNNSLIDRGLEYYDLGSATWRTTLDSTNSGLPINIKFFGAVGDGVTDDTAAFNAALSASNNIFIPEGNFVITTTISASNKTISGIRPSWNGSNLIGGSIITGILTITGNGNKISDIGITNTTGNGFVVRDNAQRVNIEGVITKVLNHGVLIEQFGGTCKDIKVINSDSHLGIHGFVSKSGNVTFQNCRAFGPSTDGFAMVSDNITGASAVSNCIDNKLINCEAYNTPIGINIYSRDYFSTVNANGIILRGLSIIGGNLDTLSAYGILVGDEAATPGGQTYNDVLNISITGVNIDNATTFGIKYSRCNGVTSGFINTTKFFDKDSNAKNCKFIPNNITTGSLGDIVFNTVLTANSTTPSLINGDTWFETNNTVSTNITQFTNAKVGQVVYIIIKDANTTIVNNSNITLNDGNITGIGSMVCLKFRNDASGFDEIFSKNINGYIKNQNSTFQTANYKISGLGEIAGINSSPNSSGSAIDGSIRLHATGNTGTVLRGGVNATNNYSWLQSSSGTDFSVQRELRINPNGGNTILNLSGGNVGISTSTPYGKFNVNGTISTTTTDFLMGSVGTVLYLKTFSNTGNTDGVIQVGQNGDNGSTGNLRLNPIGGSVGIGISPTHKLHVNGDGLFTGNLETSTDLIVQGNTTVFGPTANVVYGRYLATTAPSLSSGEAKFWAETISATTEMRVIDSAGNITTISPHNSSMIPESEIIDDMSWFYYSEREGKRINVNMYKAIKDLEKLTGNKYIYQD